MTRIPLSFTQALLATLTLATLGIESPATAAVFGTDGNGDEQKTAATTAQTATPEHVAVAFSDRGRAGPQSPIVEVPLTPLPDPPAQLTARYGERGVILDWSKYRLDRERE